MLAFNRKWLMRWTKIGAWWGMTVQMQVKEHRKGEGITGELRKTTNQTKQVWVLLWKSQEKLFQSLNTAGLSRFSALCCLETLGFLSASVPFLSATLSSRRHITLGMFFCLVSGQGGCVSRFHERIFCCCFDFRVVLLQFYFCFHSQCQENLGFIF